MSSLSVGVIFCPCLEYDYVLTSRLSGPGAQVRYLTRVLTGPENRRRAERETGTWKTWDGKVHICMQGHYAI